MQTFLPYYSYKKSARVLDNSRLGKQRSESKIILKTLLGIYEEEGRKGWPHHPATKMWAGYELSLIQYSIAVCDEWIARGNKDTCREWFVELRNDLRKEQRTLWTPHPKWMSNKKIHISHRSNLLRKDPQYYRKFWPRLRDDLPYIWPVE